jgi:hypothetical protein
MDPRMALSFRDVLVRQVDSQTQPLVKTLYDHLGALASETAPGSNQWNACDANPSTFWSSNSFSSSANSRGASFAAYMPAPRTTINTVHLTAVPRSGEWDSFPVRYRIEATDPDNTMWVSQGTYTIQPDVSGVATISLPQAITTWGVRVVPIVLGTNASGTYYFKLAEVAASLTQPVKLAMGLTSNEVKPGWPFTNAGDANLTTFYSSNSFSSASNTRGVFLSAYHADSPPYFGPTPVSTLYMNARMNGATPPVPLSFPIAYDVRVTNPDNTAWVTIGNRTILPDASGLAKIDLGNTYFTQGVNLIPTTLGVDNNGTHYFQLAELSFGVR